MIENNARRLAVGLLAALVALSAIGGGMALLVGAEAERFPSAWLSGTPFSDYTIPALLAGVILIGYVIVELLLLKQEPPGPTGTEIFYFVLGLLMCFLAWGGPGKTQQPGEPQS